MHRISVPSSKHSVTRRVRCATQRLRRDAARHTGDPGSFCRESFYRGENGSLAGNRAEYLQLSPVPVASALSRMKRIARGELHLTAVCLLAPKLTQDNHEELATQATHKSKRAIEKLLAERFPKPDVPSGVRKLPSPRPTQPSPAQPVSESRPERCDDTDATPGPQTSDMASNGEDSAAAVGQPAESAEPAAAAPTASVAQHPLSPGVVEPLSVERTKVAFTADQELVDTLERAQELLGPDPANRELAAVFGRALNLLVCDLENKKHGVTPRPRHTQQHNTDAQTEPTRTKRSRAIPRKVRRAVYERDQGQCAYRSPEGRRCCERSGLEYHHRIPFAKGGEHSLANIELRCRCHNALAAEDDFGTEVVARRVGSRVREERAPYRVRGRDHDIRGLGAHHGWLEWNHARQLIRVRRVAEHPTTGHKTVGDRYDVTSKASSELDPRNALMISRGHWRCEEETHWTADAVLHEDKRRLSWSRHPHGVFVVSLLRMMALNILAITRKLSRVRGTNQMPTWLEVVEHFLLLLCASTLLTEEFDEVSE